MIVDCKLLVGLVISLVPVVLQELVFELFLFWSPSNLLFQEFYRFFYIYICFEILLPISIF